MRLTESDKNAREEYDKELYLQNSLMNDSCCASHIVQRSGNYPKRTSFDRRRKAATNTKHPSTQLKVCHLLQRCIQVLRLIHHKIIRVGKYLWMCSSQMFLCLKYIPASYQQSSTAVKKRKFRVTRNIVISTCSTSTYSRHMQHLLHKRSFPTRLSSSSILLILILLWFSHLIGSSCAAPQSCVLCDINDFKDQPTNAHTYEEYHFEHQVTRVDAIAALKMFNGSDYGEPSGCVISCSDKVMKYCLGPQFINDHCWCELGHTEEGLPFVPHICYVGDKLYKATVGSCYFYEQVKECCCAPALAKQWRHISKACRQINVGSLMFLLILSIVFNVTCRQMRNAF